MPSAAVTVMTKPNSEVESCAGNCPQTCGLAGSMLCRCLRVQQHEVEQAITWQGCSSVREVVQATGAGSGCMACRYKIQRLLDQIQTDTAILVTR